MNIEHFVLLLMIVVSTILVSGCSSIFQEPSVTVGSVDLAHINATDLKSEYNTECGKSKSLWDHVQENYCRCILPEW